MAKRLLSHNRDRLLFDFFLIIVALVFLLNSFELGLRSWLFPGVFSIILLILAGIQTLMDLYQAKKMSELQDLISAQEGEKPFQEKIKTKLEGKHARVGLVTLSIIAFYFIFRFITIYLAIPFFCILLLRFLGKKSWLTIALVTASVDVFIYVFFYLVLQASL